VASEVEQRALELQEEYGKLDGVTPALAKLLAHQFALLENQLRGKNLILLPEADLTRIQALMTSGKTNEAFAELQSLALTEFRSGELGLTRPD